MDPFDIEIKQLFLEEAQQLLDDAEGAFLALDAGDQSPEKIDQIFRLAHNFKGSAKATGFDGLSQLSHKLEDVLVKIRNGKLTPGKIVCTVLLKALDHLKIYVTGLKMELTFTMPTSEIEEELLHCGDAQASAPNQDESTFDALAAVVTESLTSPTSTSSVPAPAIAAVKAIALKPVTKVIDPKAEQKNEEFIRVSTAKLDNLINLVGEMVVNQTVLSAHRTARTIDSDHALQTLSYLAKIVTEVQDISMSLRMMPVKPLFQKMRRALRDVSEAQKKDVDFTTLGEEVEIDKTILEKISDPLTHLIRNAVDHGIESADDRASIGKPPQAKVTLKVEQKDDVIQITVSDDGKGLNPEVLIKKAIQKNLIAADSNISDQEAYSLIFSAGFSTKEQVTDISGRGVGMDVVRRMVEEVKGSIRIESAIGKGSSFIISLPLSLSIIAGLVISVDQRKYVIPVSQMSETIELRKLRIETSTGKGRMMNLRGDVLPVMSLSSILHPGVSATNRSSRPPAFGVVTHHLGKKVAFEVDEIVGQQQVVMKKLGREMQDLPGILAGAILSNGEPGLIIDLQEFIPQRTERKSHAA